MRFCWNPAQILLYLLMNFNFEQQNRGAEGAYLHHALLHCSEKGMGYMQV